MPQPGQPGADAHMLLRSLPIDEQYSLMSAYLGTTNKGTLSYALDTARQDPYMANNVLQRRFAPDGAQPVNDRVGGGSYTNQQPQSTQTQQSQQVATQQSSSPPSAASGTYAPGDDVNASVPQNTANVNSDVPIQFRVPASTSDASNDGIAMDELLTALGIAGGAGAAGYGIYRAMQRDPVLEGEYIAGDRQGNMSGQAQRSGVVLEGERPITEYTGNGRNRRALSRPVTTLPSGAMDANGVPLLSDGTPSTYELPSYQDARARQTQLPDDDIVMRMESQRTQTEDELLSQVDANDQRVTQFDEGNMPTQTNNSGAGRLINPLAEGRTGPYEFEYADGQRVSFRAVDTARAGHFIADLTNGAVFDIRTGQQVIDESAVQILDMFRNGDLQSIIALTPDTSIPKRGVQTPHQNIGKMMQSVF